MSKQQQQCFDSIEMRRFLDEQLNEKEEAELTAHLGECSSCQQKLDVLASGKNGLSGLAKNLADHPMEATVWHSSESNEETTNRTVGDIKSLLGPTDDPSMMGRLGCYEICGIVGRGSTGIVFKAFDTRLNRNVAIKMLAPGYSVNGSSRLRFEREGRAVAAVRDDHVIPIYGVDEFRGSPYIVMQYMPAGSLQQRIDKNGPLSTREVVRIGMQIASGLAAAHRQGIIHRDVKPANVLLEHGVDRAVVTDFGLARVADEATMTHSGSISGTPQFMSPEQARGDSLDPRSDLFSLGSVMYSACAGRAPFRSETLFGVIKRVCDDQPRPIREMNPEIDLWLAAFVNKLQSKQLDDRFESANQVSEILAAEMAHLQSPTTLPEPQRRWWTKDRPDSGWSKKSKTRVLAAAGVCIAMAAFGWIAYSWNGLLGTGDLGNETSPNLLGRQDSGKSLEQFLADAATELTKDERLEQLRKNASQYFANEEYAKAEEAYRQVLDQEPENELAVLHYGVTLHMQGRIEDAIPWHKQTLKSKRYSHFGNYNLACVEAIKGNSDAAFRWLNKSIEAGYTDIADIKLDKDLESIRSDPRFQEAMLNAGKKRYSNWETDDNSVIQLDNGSILVGAGNDRGKTEEAGDEQACEKIHAAIDEQDVDRLRQILMTSSPNCSRKDYMSERTTVALPRNSPLVTVAKSGDTEIGKILLDASGADVEYSAKSEVTPLMTAAEFGNLEFVRMLLASGANINRKLNGRGTALTRAAGNGHLDVVKFLVSKGAKVNSETVGLGTALMTSCGNGHVAVAKYLLDHGAEIDAAVPGVGTPLSAASRNGHLKTAQLLVANGANLETIANGVGTALIVASRFDQSDIIDFLNSKGADIDQSVPGVGTALSVAIRDQRLDSVARLVAKGADVNTKVNGVGTALSVAAENSEFEIMEFLLAKGADIDAAVPGTGSPLSLAVRNDQKLAARYLVSKGADLNVEISGVGTALSDAARAGDVDSIKFLIKQGAKVNVKVPGVGTAVSVAARNCNQDAVEILIFEGADIDAYAPGVCNALEFAVKNNSYDIVELLLEKGANPSLTTRGKKNAISYARDLKDDSMLILLQKYESKK